MKGACSAAGIIPFIRKMLGIRPTLAPPGELRMVNDGLWHIPHRA